MASTPFNISQPKSYRIATFSQLFFSLNSSNNITCLPRKLRPSRSTNRHLSVYRNNSASSPSSSSRQVSVDRNLCHYAQRRHTFNDAMNPEPEPESEGGGGGEDNSDHHRTPISFFKLFSAITQGFIPRNSEILADQWSFLPYFLSFMQTFQRRKQSLGVLLYLIEMFGNNVEFVFRETLHDGLNLGVQWKFELEQTQVSLGKGFSFSFSQSYKGKAMIRNSDKFIKPLLHLLPFKLKIMGSFEGLREGMESLMAWEAEDKSKQMAVIFIVLTAITALLLFFRIPPFKLVFKLTPK